MHMRVAASVVVAVAVAAGMSACQFITPQATAQSYTPSDGVNGAIGEVAIRNMFLVTEDEETASLIGTLSTMSPDDQTVTLEWDTASGLESLEIEVPADGLVSLKTGADPAAEAAGLPLQQEVILSEVEAPLGGLFPVNFAIGSQDDTLRVPVLANLLTGYETLLPSPIPTPERSRRTTESPEPTEPGFTPTATITPGAAQ